MCNVADHFVELSRKFHSINFASIAIKLAKTFVIVFRFMAQVSCSVSTCHAFVCCLLGWLRRDWSICTTIFEAQVSQTYTKQVVA